jgi:hypothetical protein
MLVIQPHASGLPGQAKEILEFATTRRRLHVPGCNYGEKNGCLRQLNDNGVVENVVPRQFAITPDLRRPSQKFPQALFQTLVKKVDPSAGGAGVMTVINVGVTDKDVVLKSGVGDHCLSQTGQEKMPTLLNESDLLRLPCPKFGTDPGNWLDYTPIFTGFKIDCRGAPKDSLQEYRAMRPESADFGNAIL